MTVGENAPRRCPYVGLQPFEEADREFFFGRERDQRIIIANLLASPLTILYRMFRQAGRGEPLKTQC